MSNEAEILPNLLREETFEIVMRGYNRRQVDEYIARTRNQIRELEARLSRALDEVERTRREMAEVRDTHKPTGDDLSERLRQIINLAEEEAQSKLGDADQKVNQIRQDAEKEAKRVIDEAHGKSEHMVAQAQENANHLLSAAKQEADRVLTAARHDAETMVSDARNEAERTLTTAERRSSVINEGASERLTKLTKQHTQAIGRLREISETLGSLLQSDERAGSLEEMVNEAVASGRVEQRPEGPKPPVGRHSAESKRPQSAPPKPEPTVITVESPEPPKPPEPMIQVHPPIGELPD